MKEAHKPKTGKEKGKMKKAEKEKKAVERNVFGYKEGTNKAFISDMFLEDGITLQNAAKKVERSLDKEPSKAISMVLGTVKRLMKKGHKVEVLITTPAKKNAEIKKVKENPKAPAKTDSMKPIKPEAESSQVQPEETA